MAPGLFVYGSLMSFAVLESLIYRVPKMLPAYIPGMTRLKITTEVYPAIMKTSLMSEANFPEIYHEEVRPYFNADVSTNQFTKIRKSNFHVNKVQGFVLKNLSSQEGAILDYFESDAYNKERLPVVVGYDKNWNVEEADVYVYKSDKVSELFDFWDFDAFCKKHLDSYLDMCTECRIGYFNSLQKPPKYKPLKE